ncbi:hypothetical protein GT037_011280 [Alternaria burnsii]|uniref:Uncharacterized protein n=1 Tax=Alternaria burnsii TaxID=1187904 RepID=A0A8H7ASD1_9PLEO|nr:uncharacterized protein GT037_011280 [Alternaria burnsii]KAF7670604.1 hypothetical protein GT037_011280 [Alternaria burnsii]
MKISAIASAFLVTAASAATIPQAASSKDLEARQQTGSYTISGLGSRKRQVTAAGASSLNLAIAMLETERMDTNYAYGDNKQNDAANFGIFKQNWGMLRVCCSRFKGQSQSSWNNGAVLNSNLNADVQCLNECQSYYGQNKWIAGHRNGETGLNNPNTQDIRNYIDGVKYIENQLLTQPNGLTNDVRYYIYVVPI